MEDDSVPVKNAPRTWGAAARMLQKGEGNVTDADLFGDDPLAPKEKRRPLDYLGHFAKDEVAEEGHNFGAPRISESKLNIKRSYDGDTAKRGYKVIPGNADAGYVKKKVRQEIATMSSAAGPYRYGGPIPSGPYGPMPGSDSAAPLRKAARSAKAAAGRGIGEATLHSKRK